MTTKRKKPKYRFRNKFYTVLLISIVLLTWVQIKLIKQKPSLSFSLNGLHSEIIYKIKAYEEKNVWTEASNYSLEEYTYFEEELTPTVMSLADKKQAKILTEYPNGMIKFLAYRKLIKTEPDSASYYIKQALRDTTFFYMYKSNCGTICTLVGEAVAMNCIDGIDGMLASPPDLFIEPEKLAHDEIKEIQDLYVEVQRNKPRYFDKYYSPLR